MEAGCCVLSQSTPEPDRSLCPECGAAGKPVGMQTLKALLLPEALRLLNAESGFRFCATATCQTLYFSSLQSFRVDAIAIPVTKRICGPKPRSATASASSGRIFWTSALARLRRPRLDAW